MVLDAHPGEGQPVQRRVSYRRLREEENAKATSIGGDPASLLPIKGVFDGDSRGTEDIYDDSIAASPSSIWQEAWLALRCGTYRGRRPICIPFRTTLLKQDPLALCSTSTSPGSFYKTCFDCETQLVIFVFNIYSKCLPWVFCFSPIRHPFPLYSTRMSPNS